MAQNVPSDLWKLAEQCAEDSKRWFPDMDANSLPFHVLAMCGEAGELANIVKKVMRGSLDIRDPNVRKQLDMEATDVLVYLLLVFHILKCDPQRMYDVVRRQNEERFGNGVPRVRQQARR